MGEVLAGVAADNSGCVVEQGGGTDVVGDVGGEPVALVRRTNASVSLTMKPYSASARIATRFFSHSDVSEPLIVTVASVEMRYEMPPMAPHAACDQSPA